MQFLTRCLGKFIALFAICGLGLVFTHTANAMAIYDALADLSLELTGVNNAIGAPVAEGWSVLVYSSRTSALSRTDADGDASATIVPTLTTAPAGLSVGDSIFQSAEAYGEATNGRAISELFTDLGISVDNLSGEDLTFTFAYEVSAQVTVSGSVPDGDDASADAQLQIFDDLGSIDIALFPYAELIDDLLSDSMLDIGIFSFTIPTGGTNEIGAFIDALGDATAEAVQGVPEPTILSLLGIGLFVVGYARKRAQP